MSNLNQPPPATGIGAGAGVGAGVRVTGPSGVGVGVGVGAGVRASNGPPGVGVRASNGPPGVGAGVGAGVRLSNGPLGVGAAPSGIGIRSSTGPKQLASNLFNTTNPSSKPLTAGKKSLKDSSGVPSARPLKSGAIDLPLLAPTGPQTYVRNQNRQSPPPLPAPALSAPAIPSIPAAPKVTVNPNVRDCLTVAIESAQEGSEIVVPQGEYKESLKVNKNLHFLAQGTVKILSDSVIDNVTAGAPFVSFRGFTFIQSESQSSGAAIINTGSCLFENCSFSAHYMPSITVKNDGKLFLRKCRVECEDAAALMCRDESVTVCEETTFKAPKNNGVLVRNNSTARFSRCQVEQCARNAFVFMDTSNFIFENATIDKNFEVQSQSQCAIVKNCNVAGTYLKINGSATPYILSNTFNGCGLECNGVSGVRLQGNTFQNNVETPALLVFGDSTVECHDDTFKQCRAGAAVVAYRNGELKVNDGKLYDLAGVAFLCYGNSQLELCHTAIVNAANGGVVAHSDATLILSETLIDRVGGVGVLLKKPVKAELKKSKITHCALSGVEANNVIDFSVDHCIFDDNTQCGVVGIQSTVNINESDFTNNKYAGLDLRECQCTVTKSIACNNQSGGFAFRNNSTGNVEGGGLGENNQFGLCVDTGANITVKEVKFIANQNLAAYASTGGSLTLVECNVTQQSNVAVEADGNESRVEIQKCELVQNGTAVQVNDGASAEINDTKLFDNGTHLEISAYAKVNARGSTFQQSRNGIGVAIAANGSANIDDCKINDEAKAGIANAGTLNITGTSISECGTCGVFWHGEANGSISNSEILRNGPCGIQMMKGSCTISGNTIEGHTAFGVHVDKEASLTNAGNTFSQNTISDVNNEQ
ncbi:hypothetical protein TRFO_19903 [Tritrichomonas foetus]|uniref:Right handed beta helix domain-containing protein n=1 Tax=Tritrichomonas foetus TaxID=1144522 RepID=A0A1J4KLT5_9EUKA|nr:hypothetical protein TRFO_19903 [Tritrichomonas foetus]|eukprot:OHT10764.1 hypothetical protein TRFO_19903 [Tritrichomonas foetus]